MSMSSALSVTVSTVRSIPLHPRREGDHTLVGFWPGARELSMSSALPVGQAVPPARATAQSLSLCPNSLVEGSCVSKGCVKGCLSLRSVAAGLVEVSGGRFRILQWLSRIPRRSIQVWVSASSSVSTSQTMGDHTHWGQPPRSDPFHPIRRGMEQ